MSNNEPKTRQEKEPEAVGPPTADCWPFCTHGRARAFERVAEQRAEPAEGQTTAAPSDTGTARGGGCGGEMMAMMPLMGGHLEEAHTDPALETLRQRFASGDLTQQEYEEQRNLLLKN